MRVGGENQWRKNKRGRNKERNKERKGGRKKRKRKRKKERKGERRRESASFFLCSTDVPTVGVCRAGS